MDLLKAAGLKGITTYSLYEKGLKDQLDSLLAANRAWKTPDNLAVFDANAIPGGPPYS